MNLIFEKKKNYISKIIYVLEVILAAAVILAVIFYALNSSIAFINYDWAQINTFQEVMNSVLILVLGLELARLLITHDIYSIGNLLTYVVARKALKPELTSVDLLFVAIAFAILFILNIKFAKQK